MVARPTDRDRVWKWVNEMQKKGDYKTAGPVGVNGALTHTRPFIATPSVLSRFCLSVGEIPKCSLHVISIF